MNISKRTKMSLTQFLELFDREIRNTIFDKYNISYKDRGNRPLSITEVILQIDIPSSIASILEEIIKTKGCLRNNISPKYTFDERWKDLTDCLLLDGFKVESDVISSIEPFIEANTPIEDDLTKEISASSLPKAEKIIEHINRSAQLFLKSQPDYNGCLTNARIALETLVRDIAESKGFQITNERTAWGSSLAHLKTINFLNEKEEKTIASIYSFVSDGAHVPLGFTEEEYARFGRNLVTSICYFIAKLLSAT